LTKEKDDKHTISFFSHRGGRGKSTFAANLAVQISERSYKTLLIDMDIHAPQLQFIFKTEPSHYINDVFSSRISSVSKNKSLKLKDAVTKTNFSNLDIIYAFSKMSTLSAVILTAWLVLVALVDGPLKAVLLGRGAPVPMLVIFLGAIGGFISLGFLGLFIGAVVLSVGYKLFEVWLQEDARSVSTAEVSESAK